MDTKETIATDRTTPPTQETVAVSARLTIQTGFIFLVLLFVIGGSWAQFTTLSGAVVVPGHITVEGRAKAVQHPDGGVVAEILIADGDHVENGAALLRLDDTLLRTERDMFTGRLHEALARRARLEAERDNAGAMHWDPGILEMHGLTPDIRIIAGQQKLFQARKNARLGRIAMLTERIRQFEDQISGWQAVNESLTRQIASMDTELASVRALRDKGLVTVSRVLDLERRRETLVGKIAEQEAEIARIQDAIGEARIQILQIDREFRQDVLTRLREADSEIGDTVQNLAATRERLRRVNVRAPVSGEVYGLSVVTIGGVIAAGETVLRIVPQTDQFEVEVFIEPRFVDDVFPGQSAVLRLSAFNTRTTPDLHGTVRSVSADVIADQQSGAPVYSVRLTVTGSELARLGERQLVQGMPVEVFIQTGQRSPLDYLLKPLSDQVRRAFREE